MKKLLLSLFAIFTITQLSAQGDLQFNRALYENIYAFSSSNPQIITGAFTVPNGKIWKVSSIIGTNYSSSIFRKTIPGHCLTGTNEFHNGSNGWTAGDYSIQWFPAGTYDLKIQKASTAYDYYILITGIEFNINP